MGNFDRDANHVPGLIAVSAADFSTTGTPVNITGRSLTSAIPIDVSIVDGSGAQITSFGGGTQYTDAAAAPAHPVGTMPIFNNAGTWAQVSNTAGLPVNIVAGAGSGGTALADGATFTEGTTSLTPVGGEYNTALGSLTSGKAGVVALTVKRAFHVNARDSSGVEAIVPGTAATHLGKAEDSAHTSGDVGVFSLNLANEAQSTLAADGDYIGGATDTKGNHIVVGNVAHDGADAGFPVKIGGKAANAEPAAVANNDRTNLITDLVGKLIVLPYANPENFVSGLTAAMTGTTSTSLVAAPASGLRNYITHIIATNSHATVGTFVLIQDGSGGTTLYEGYCAAAGGGFSITLPVPLRQPTTATALYCQNVTTGANVIVSASGFKGT